MCKYTQAITKFKKFLNKYNIILLWKNTLFVQVIWKKEYQILKIPKDITINNKIYSSYIYRIW